MPKLSVVVPHRLAEPEALGRMQGMLSDLKTQYEGRFTDLRETWTGNNGRFSVKAMGFDLSGAITVKPAAVELTGDLPFAATPFKGRLEEMVRERVERLLV